MSREEIMDDLHEPQPEDPVFENVVNMIRQEYAKCQRRPEIRKPLAYALYKVWREVDRK